MRRITVKVDYNGLQWHIFSLSREIYVTLGCGIDKKVKPIVNNESFAMQVCIIHITVVGWMSYST